MKKGLFILSLCTLLAMATTDTHAQSKKGKVLRHVVLFAFKSTATPEDIKKVEQAFIALPGKIKTIKDFEWGTNSSPEGVNQGLTHCFFLTFSSDKDRDDYLVHPDHKAFGAIVGPVLEKVTVVDYWTN
ncbi:Dabb family protein [Chryseolinea sp. T2]